MTPPDTPHPAVQGAPERTRGNVPELGKQGEDREDGPDTARDGRRPPRWPHGPPARA